MTGYRNLAANYRAILWDDTEGSNKRYWEFLRKNLLNNPKRVTIGGWSCESLIFKDGSVYGFSQYVDKNQTIPIPSTLYYDPD